jgi:hypothetical protein
LKLLFNFIRSAQNKINLLEVVVVAEQFEQVESKQFEGHKQAKPIAGIEIQVPPF